MSGGSYNLAEGHAQVLDTSVRFSAAKGSLLRTEDGREVIDLHNNGSLPLGHDHDLMAEAFAGAPPLNVGKYGTDGKDSLIARLAEWLPGYSAFQLYSNGTAANEGMLRYAMAITQRSAFIGFHGAFHGHTKALVSVTEMDPWHGDRIPGYRCLPYPGYDHDAGGVAPAADPEAWLRSAEAAIDEVGAERVAGVMMEPILGKVIIAPPPGLLERLVSEVLAPRGILLLADEYMTSVRTGSWLAARQQGVEPDLITFGKAVKTGVPFAALACRADLADGVREVKGEDSASGQAPICRAVELTVERLMAERWLERVGEISGAFADAMGPLADRGQIVRASAHGALLGIELPSRAAAQAVAARSLENGALVAAIKRCVRMTPALNIERDLLERALLVVGEAVAEATG